MSTALKESLLIFFKDLIADTDLKNFCINYHKLMYFSKTLITQFESYLKYDCS